MYEVESVLSNSVVTHNVEPLSFKVLQNVLHWQLIKTNLLKLQFLNYLSFIQIVLPNRYETIQQHEFEILNPRASNASRKSLGLV